MRGAAAGISFADDEVLNGKIDVHSDALCGKYLFFQVFGDQSKEYLDIAVMKCVSMGSSGRHGSRMETLQMLFKACQEKWHPKAIFIIGCCGSTTAEVGTVLVASDIIHYNRGKLTRHGTEWKPDSSYSCDSNWLGNIQRMEQMSHHARKVVFQSVDRFLSGDYVVKCEHVARVLSELVPDRSNVGIEMEGVGVAEAIRFAKLINTEMPLPLGVDKLPLPEFVIVKGVSDPAGIDKNEPCNIYILW